MYDIYSMLDIPVLERMFLLFDILFGVYASELIWYYVFWKKKNSFDVTHSFGNVIVDHNYQSIATSIGYYLNSEVLSQNSNNANLWSN